MPVPTIQWSRNALQIIDQTRLPEEVAVIQLDTIEQVWEAIKSLRIRGAPAIGICAAFGLLVAVRDAISLKPEAFRARALEAADYLATARPTAVNLFWALDRMRRVLNTTREQSTETLWRALENEALAIFEEDRRICRAIGEHGAGLIRANAGVLTHCNAGGLATADYGTALAVMFRAHESGVPFRVYAGETRPLLQGARLTAWELAQSGIDVTVICDNMAAQVMREGKIDLVIVGADRIAANGDTANKIGTYGVATLAKAHGIPFYVAAPTSTFDLHAPDGRAIPIEQRDRGEIAHGFGRLTVPEGAKVYNPAFDVTPAGLIAGIITEKGILAPPLVDSIAATL